MRCGSYIQYACQDGAQTLDGSEPSEGIRQVSTYLAEMTFMNGVPEGVRPEVRQCHLLGVRHGRRFSQILRSVHEGQKDQRGQTKGKLDLRNQWTRHSSVCRSMVMERQGAENSPEAEDLLASCVVVVPNNGTSPLGKHEEVSWLEVMQHIAKRLTNINPRFRMKVATEAEVEEGGPYLARQARNLDLMMVIGIQDTKAASTIRQHSQEVKTALFFDCAASLQQLTKLDGLQADSIWLKVFGKVRFTRSSRIQKILGTVREFWDRDTSDDILFIFLVLIDSFIVEVETVRALRAQDLNSIGCMISNCRRQILDCMTNPECRVALDCLQKCAPNDQVCSYRCIASHETPQFEAFSLCILQKHNCLGLNVKIPSLPAPSPMAAFRGQPLTHESAEQLFIGWLDSKQWSWRVVGGQNAAYDQFPCQYQLYYRGKAKNTLWYDPVFQVRTYDGRTVWRKRHYRVRRAEEPGTFRFSVLDNGVTSNEFWRILDVKDDLSWGLFFYSGAASVVGQSYTGAVLCTPDGEWPKDEEQERIKAALDRADIKMWELYRVDNCGCHNPPLGIPDKDSAANPLANALQLA